MGSPCFLFGMKEAQDRENREEWARQQRDLANADKKEIKQRIWQWGPCGRVLEVKNGERIYGWKEWYDTNIYLMKSSVFKYNRFMMDLSCSDNSEQDPSRNWPYEDPSWI